MGTNEERRNEILNLRENGLSYSEISKRLNCSKSLVAFYCTRCDIEKQKQREESKKEYEKIVCDLVKRCDNINQVCKELGKKQTTANRLLIKRIIEKYKIDTSHFVIDYAKRTNKKKMDDCDIFVINSSYQTAKLKNRLILKGYKEYKCEMCGRTTWEGKPIPLQTHHINGDNSDNRIENLQLLCPNCHAFTDTYCGKNISKSNLKEIHAEKECEYCGKKFRNVSGKKYCSDECRKLAMNIIDDAELKEKIIRYASENCTFRYIGKMMGVSDNAVRKWCLKIGLPTKTSELKNYISNL